MANRAAIFRAQEDKPVKRRGKHFIEFDLGGGETRHISTIEPLHYGELYDQEIDTAWEADTGAWQWRIVKNHALIHSRNIFNVGSLFEWRIGDEWVIIDPQSINWIDETGSREQIAIKQGVTGVPDDDLMRFTDAYGSGRHYELQAHPKRLIKHITIDELTDLPEPAPWLTGEIWFEAEFTIANSSGVELYLDGVEWDRKNKKKYTTANRIEFRDAQGIAQWYADAPYATDANGETTGAQYEVEASGGTYFIRVRVPRSWLAAAEYPVRIDPTFTDGYGGDVTTYCDDGVSNAVKTYNFGTNATLFIRSDRKTLARFVLENIPSGATCNSAPLYLYFWYNPSNQTATIYEISNANGDWIEGTKSVALAGAGEPCWNAKEADGSGGVTTAWAGSAGLATSGTDYKADSIGSFSMTNGDSQGQEYSPSLDTDTVAAWFGEATNNGVLVVGTDSSAENQICASDHATTGYRPKLVVDYTAGDSASASRRTLIGVGI